MKEPKSLNSVKEFHMLFRHPVLDTPQIPAAKRCALRVNLLSEELKEMEEAIAANDIVGVADALADLQYVLAGAILEFGLGEKFADIFNEVQRSNMSKACKSEEEANATVDFYTKDKGEPHYWTKTGDDYLVYRTSDNKTVKSINYSPADLASIVNREDVEILVKN
ncbi:MAG: nucleoside triphosphate pyrophosphohydrolase family protein [Richelia sp. RM2_1_2]|nr:nucleoside triphosphate pyrophosphohydrolase family protein [Richelia sp. RM2_1_2]